MKGHTINTTTLPLTDRARRVIREADTERARLGNAALTPQHVLWALLREEGSVAALVLRDLHFDRASLAERLGPDWHATGPAKASDEDLPAAAVASARELGHSCVDTAHLLLGMLRGESRVSKLLRAEGVSYDAAAEATRRFWPQAVA